jgi:hypothetical protein
VEIAHVAGSGGVELTSHDKVDDDVEVICSQWDFPFFWWWKIDLSRKEDSCWWVDMVGIYAGFDLD